jgi:hypothetical protein
MLHHPRPPHEVARIGRIGHPVHFDVQEHALVRGLGRRNTPGVDVDVDVENQPVVGGAKGMPQRPQAPNGHPVMTVEPVDECTDHSIELRRERREKYGKRKRYEHDATVPTDAERLSLLPFGHRPAL